MTLTSNNIVPFFEIVVFLYNKGNTPYTQLPTAIEVAATVLDPDDQASAKKLAQDMTKMPVPKAFANAFGEPVASIITTTFTEGRLHETLDFILHLAHQLNK